MKKVVELVVKLGDLEFDDVHVDAVAMVENPAIEMPFMHFSEDIQLTVDNSGFETMKEWMDTNKELFKRPGGGAAGKGGVDHGAQMKLLKEQGIDTDYPFGYCFQIAQFAFYASGGYQSDWNLMCIKGMEYEVAGQHFESTHWYIQNNVGRIVDLSAEQFDGILNIEEHYKDGRRANLGYPYYVTKGKGKKEFENTVPSYQTLKLYSYWKEEHGELEGIEKYYKASQYEKYRKEFAAFAATEELPYIDIEEAGIDMAYDEFLKLADELGEAYDPTNVTYIDTTQDKFDNIGDFMKGLGALDLLNRKDIRKEKKGRTMYRYAGPTPTSNSRNFCRAMFNKNKLYTRANIQQMRGLNSDFGHNGQSYSIWAYKGGKFCRHYWEELTVFEGSQSGNLIFLSHGPAGGNAGTAPDMMPTRGAYSKYGFSVDEEQRIVVGPVLVPNKLIKRIDKESGEEYFVYFSEQTVRDVAELMFKRNLQNRTNIEHASSNTDNDNTLLEQWIVDNPELDKSKAYGLEVPKGTLMQSRRINDDSDWEKIKAGVVKGFSVEGAFLERVAKESEVKSDDQMMTSIMDILSQIKS